MARSDDHGPHGRPIPYEILHSLGEGVALADAEGRIVFSNRAADRMLGVPATDAPPSAWAHHYGIYLPDGSTPFPADEYPLVRALKGEETDEIDMVVRNAHVPNGAVITVTGRPLHGSDGTIRGAAVTFRDVTRLRTAERALRDTIEELRDNQRMRDELTALMVHDLKSPLAVVMTGADELMTRPGLSDHDLDWLRDVRESAESMHRMAMDLLDVHVSEDGQLEPELETLALDELFDAACRGMRRRAALKSQTIEVTDRAAGTIVGDPELLARVLRNLVDNCVKYGPAGGIIRLEARRPARETILLTVSDDGPGVPPALRRQIFEKYARVERAGRRHRESRGLGLRFCLVVAEAHGGRIWIEENEPTGARFCLELPAEVD